MARERLNGDDGVTLERRLVYGAVAVVLAAVVVLSGVWPALTLSLALAAPSAEPVLRPFSR